MNATLQHNDTDGTVWQIILLEPELSLDKRQAQLRALVLDSRSIPCCIMNDGETWQLLVPEQHAASARMELRLHEERNRNWPPSIPATRAVFENTLPTISVLILLATFHNITLIDLSLPGYGLLDLNELGVAHAADIRNGQLWRAVTALTLHADLTHLLSNLTIGGVFIILLCRELGSGLAWSLLLCSGALGNLLNAWVQSPDHRSVGASTAVFAAVGILTTISSMREQHQLQRRWFVPLAAGLALLALLGTEGKQTDLGAHLFGFGFGALFGLVEEYLTARFGRPGRLLNALLALSGAALVVAAWQAALSLGSN
ncbi:MAG TPA: rhomboid family intramembrane serine protease [Desulfuromonadales bacterium]|nr:rhomboid family intramembrane serine protease [Desulfuromonadales bacterium]